MPDTVTPVPTKADSIRADTCYAFAACALRQCKRTTHRHTETHGLVRRTSHSVWAGSTMGLKMIVFFSIPNKVWSVALFWFFICRVTTEVQQSWNCGWVSVIGFTGCLSPLIGVFVCRRRCRRPVFWFVFSISSTLLAWMYFAAICHEGQTSKSHLSSSHKCLDCISRSFLRGFISWFGHFGYIAWTNLGNFICYHKPFKPLPLSLFLFLFTASSTSIALASIYDSPSEALCCLLLGSSSLFWCVPVPACIINFYFHGHSHLLLYRPVSITIKCTFFTRSMRLDGHL